MIDNDVVERLITSYTTKDENEALDALIYLRPDTISIEKLSKLVNHVESICLTGKYNWEHYNSIGTGGDELKTINITSMAAIRASRYLNIIKMGARGITSKWGSKDFNSLIENNEKFLSNPDFHFYNDKSRFLSFGELGISYENTLVNARKKLNEMGMLDIYKVIFPFSNVTNCTAQVNGVSNEQYLDIYTDLSLKFSRRVIILLSSLGVDELMPGLNQYVKINKGKLERFSLFIESDALNDLKEEEEISEVLAKFYDIMSGKARLDIQKIINYNAASIINLIEMDKSIEDTYWTYFSNKH